MPATVTFGCLNPTGTAYTVQYNNNSGTICLEPSNTIYTSGSFGTGVIVYTDVSLTTLLTGYNYIVEVLSGVIYNLNPSTGEIGSSTGLIC